MDPGPILTLSDRALLPQTMRLRNSRILLLALRRRRARVGATYCGRRVVVHDSRFAFARKGQVIIPRDALKNGTCHATKLT